MRRGVSSHVQWQKLPTIIRAYTGGSAPGLYVPLRPIPPQNQLPVADGSLVLAHKSFLDHEGLSLRAAILPQLLHLQGQVGSGGDIVTALHDTAINLAMLNIPAAGPSQSPTCHQPGCHLPTQGLG